MPVEVCQNFVSFIQSYQQLQRPTHQSRLLAAGRDYQGETALSTLTHTETSTGICNPSRVLSEGCSKVGTWAQQERTLRQPQQENQVLA